MAKIKRQTRVLGCLGLLAVLMVNLPAVSSAETIFTAVDPAGDMSKEKPVVRDIPDLNDPAFRERLTGLLSDIRQRPTGADTVRQRLPLIRDYYDALQMAGVLLNWQIIYDVNMLMTGLASGTAIDDRRAGPLMKTLDHRVAEMRLAEQLRGRTGRFLLVQPEKPVLTAKRYATVKLVYIADTPLQAETCIRIGQNWYSDLGKLQSKRPLQANYFTVSCSNPDVTVLTAYRSWQGTMFTGGGGNTAHVILKNGPLRKGDKLEFTLGDRSGGSPGWLIQSFTGEMELKLEADLNADGVFVPLAQPRFLVIGNDAHHIRVAAPSVIHAGDRFTVRASVEDPYFNRAGNPPKELTLWLGDKIIAKAASVKNDPATFHFTNVSLPGARRDPAYFRVTGPDPALSGTSNPVVTVPDDRPYLYWGELHGHEGYSDANSSPEWYMNYAKNVAFLDFASLTGHDIFLSEVHFRDIFRVTDRYHSPEDGFVTFRAYEWTNGPEAGGHHNVFFLDDRQRVVPLYQGFNLQEMYRLQRKLNDPARVLIIPHAHSPGDWNVMGPAELVEIYSQHGSFEWFGRRYLQKGHKIGLHAASDDHTGHPGNSPSRGRSRGGLAGVFSDKLNREAVFNNLKRRHTYGTSLARIYLQTDVHGAPMGDDAVIDRARHPSIKLTGFTAGTSPIAKIAAVVNGEDVKVQDFLAATGQTTVLRFRIHRSSEPDTSKDPRNRRPARDTRYWGRIIIGEAATPGGYSHIGGSRTVISEMKPLGTEEYGDFQSHTGNREALFSWRMRGDHDGMLLTLERFDPADTVTIIIYTSAAIELEYWNTQEQPLLPGEYWASDLPGGKVLLRETVSLGELTRLRWSKGFDETARADLEMVDAGLPMFRRFDFDLNETHGLKPGKNNHIYVRVEQLDDETAWSSPTFIEWR